MLLLSCAISATAQQPIADTNTVVLSSAFIDRLAEEFRTNHPALRAADARADAAVWNAAGIRTWEDPMAKFGVMGAERERRMDDGDLLYGIEQKLPVFGKPQAARDAAQSEATTQRHEAMFRAVTLRNALTKQLVKVASAERTLEFSRTDLASLDTIVASTEEKYRNGFATQVEALQSQNERARRANLLRTEENLLAAERASLNRYLNRPVDAPWPRLLLPPIITNLPPVALMIEHSTTMAPQIDVARASLRQAEASIRLAQKQRLPDMTVGLEGRQYADTGEFREGVVMLGLSIPWGNRGRYNADIKREQRKAEAAQFEIADMQLSLRDEITRLAIQVDNAAREATLYRADIIPRTEQTLAGAQANWLNARGTLRDVLEARRMLLDAQVMETRATAEQHTMIADLLLHCGLNDLQELSIRHPQPGTVIERRTP